MKNAKVTPETAKFVNFHESLHELFSEHQPVCPSFSDAQTRQIYESAETLQEWYDLLNWQPKTQQ